MKFGIQENNKQILCNNCGRVVSKTNELTNNFCGHCGNPLSIYAIDKKEKEIQELEKDYLTRLKDIALDLKLDSFKEILKQLED